MGVLLPGERNNIVEFLSSAAAGDPVDRLIAVFEKAGTDVRGHQGNRLRFDRAGLSEKLEKLRSADDPLESLARLSVEAPMHGLFLPPYLDPLQSFHDGTWRYSETGSGVFV